MAEKRKGKKSESISVFAATEKVESVVRVRAKQTIRYFFSD